MKYLKLTDVKSPSRAGDREAGIDFYIPNDAVPAILELGDSIVIGLGIKCHIPTGYMLRLSNKSGVAVKRGLVVGAGTVDETYQGELKVNLFKNARGEEDGAISIIEPGDKIVQGVLIPVNYAMPEEVQSLEELYHGESYRGTNGIGSNFEE